MSEDRPAAVALTTLLISLAPSVAMATALLRILDRHPGRIGGALMLGASLAVATIALWSVGQRIIRSVGPIRVLAVAAAGLTTAWSFVRHVAALLTSGSLAERLMWLLDMEDNARFVGVAREMIAGAPSGGRLASEFGTGFMSSAVLASGTWRGVPSGDPRAAAVDVMNLSVALAIVMVALVVITVSLTAMETPRSHRESLRAIASIPMVAAAVAASLWVAVAVPMRSGFLSFIWGVVWVSLAASLIPLVRHVSGWRRALLLVALASTVALLIDSWPFLLAGLAPLLAFARWRRSDRPVERTWTTKAIRAAVGSVGLVVGAVLLWNSPVRSVFGSVGLAVLEVEGTSITTDPWMRFLAAAAVLLGLLAAFLTSTQSGRERIRDIATTPEASAAALGASVLGLFVLALVLNDGDWGYAGRKLLHGAVTVALIVALPALLSRVVASRIPVAAGAGAAGLIVLLNTPVVGFSQAWGEQVDVHLQPHALVVADAIRVTSPELPIRCLPPERTPATSGARWAAYFCVNWVEDAFNEDRFDGFRMDMLLHDDEDFDELIDRMLTERSSEYLFSHRIIAGPGWAHWDGTT